MPCPSSICQYPQHVLPMSWNGALILHYDLCSISHVPRDVVLGERRLEPVGQLLEAGQVALDGGTFTRSTYGNS
eukprot:9096787-Pyramimonas_sp.AAC.1